MHHRSLSPQNPPTCWSTRFGPSHRSRILLRRLLAWIPPALVALCFALPALAADEVLGKWEATLESPRGTREITMEFTGTSDSLQGTWTGPRGTFDLEDVSYADGKLTFQRNLEVQGNSITIDYEATVDGDAMNVKMTTPRGEREFTAKRADP